MSELAFQHALARILTDPAARAALLDDGDDPPAAEAGCSEDGPVPPEVRARLRALDRQRTLIFSRILLVNRLTKIAEVLPYTSRTIGMRLWPLIEEYNRQFPPSHPRKLDEAAAFTRFVESLPDISQLGPPWLKDLLHYESSVLTLRFQPVAPPACQRTWSERDADHPEEVYPRRSEVAAVKAFGYDIEQIINAFELSQPVPENLTPRPMLILLQAMPDGSIRQDEVSPSIGELFDLCTGDRSLAQVAGQLADRLGAQIGSVREGIVTACAELVQRGVLLLD